MLYLCIVGVGGACSVWWERKDQQVYCFERVKSAHFMIYCRSATRFTSFAGVLQHSQVIATGLRIEGTPLLAGVLAGVDPSVFGVSECTAPECPWTTAPMRGQQHDGIAALGSRGRQDGVAVPPTAALHGAVSVVDSVIALSPRERTDVDVRAGGDVPCVMANGSVYLSNVYVSGCRVAVMSGGRAPVLVPDGVATAHVPLLALGRHTTNAAMSHDGADIDGFESNESRAFSSWQYAFPSYENGKRSANGITSIVPASKESVPLDLTSRHWLGPEGSPEGGGGVTWQHANAVSALDLGCKGDGMTDDWAVLQRAVDSHDVVVLPKGFYRIGKTLTLRRHGGALVGVGRTLSVLMPTSDATAFGEHPVVDVNADGVTVCALTVATWDHVPLAFAVRWGGAEGIWRQSFFNRVQGKHATFS